MGSRLGIIGEGILGQHMTKIGRALGMDVVFSAHKGRYDMGPEFMPFEEVLASCDIIM